MTIGQITWTKYVLHTQQEAYEKEGWEVAGCLKGTPHGHWSVIMKWVGEGEPKIPELKEG